MPSTVVAPGSDRGPARERPASGKHRLLKPRYRPEIDGLRAIAVGVVILFHFGVGQLPQGFLGVDIFFVISGYLITQVIISEGRGGFSLIRFYDRRVRRILPALILVLVFTLAAGWFVLLPADYASLGSSAAYAAFGTANLYYLGHTGYFDRAAGLQPLLNLWSLGVEEQFYLVWPGCLILLIGLRRTVHRLAVVGALTAVGLALYLATRGSIATQAFYLPQYRAWELSLGGLLTLAPPLRGRLASEFASACGLLLIAGSTTAGMWASAALIASCAGAGLIIWPRAERSVVDALLSWRLPRLIGLISYSLYLIHWPLLVLFKHITARDDPTFAQGLGLLALCGGLAYASWRLVEQPFRRARLRPAAGVICGVAAATLVAGAGLLVARDRGFPGRVPADVAALSDVERTWAWPCPDPAVFAGSPLPTCRFGAPWADARVKGLVVGDSHAQHLEPMLDAISRGRSWAFEDFVDCPAAFGGHVHRRWVEFRGGDYSSHCKQLRSTLVAGLRGEPDINLVVLASIWTRLAPSILLHDATLPPGAGGEALLVAGLEDFIQQTARPGRRFLVMADVPIFPADPVPCAVAKASTLLRTRCRIADHVSQASFWDDQKSWIERIVAMAATRDDVDVFAPGIALCASGTCTSYLDGEFLYRDADHLRRNMPPATYAALAEASGLTAKLTRIASQLTKDAK